MDIALLDTDTVSELLKQRNPIVKRHATQYARSHGQFAISAFTRFEMDRGFRESGASRQRVMQATLFQLEPPRALDCVALDHLCLECAARLARTSHSA